MYTNLVLYRNELKNKSIPRYKLLGITIELLLSKKIFPRNRDINSFIINIFGFELKDYILKSRTMVIARVSKEIVSMESHEKMKSNLLDFVNMQIEIIKESESIKDKKNDFAGWIR